MAQLIQINDLVAVYKALDPSFCREIIDLFEKDPNKWQGRTVTEQGEFKVDEKIMKTHDLEIQDEGEWSPIFQKLHLAVIDCMRDYILRSPVLQKLNINATGYKIQKYRKNEGYFRWHADAIGKGAIERLFSMIIYLNDVAEGGETEFHHQEINIKPLAGQLVLFPAAWNYTHRGNTPLSADKYIINSFGIMIFRD